MPRAARHGCYDAGMTNPDRFHAVILSAVRTPIGRLQGPLGTLHPRKLGGAAIRAATRVASCAIAARVEGQGLPRSSARIVRRSRA